MNDVPTLCPTSSPGHREMVGHTLALEELTVGRISPTHPLCASPSHLTSSWPNSGDVCIFPITWPGLWLCAFFKVGSPRTEAPVLLAEVLLALTRPWRVVGVQLILV